MAEAILNHRGYPNFKAYSAGSYPLGAVKPEALRQLQASQLPIEGLRSKSWEEFANAEGPKVDFVITVCDSAAKEVRPVWLGHPLGAHWGIPGPAAVFGTAEEVKHAYSQAFGALERRIKMLIDLPLRDLTTDSLKNELEAIGLQ